MACACSGGDGSPSGMLIAHLGRGDGTGLAAIQEAFVAGNPGYGLDYTAGARHFPPTADTRLVFIQAGETRGYVGDKTSDVAVADVILLRPSEDLRTDAAVDALVFTVPEPAPQTLPTFLRPDWDPNITDVVGGCATEEGAYRRLILTWAEENGTYLYHGLNSHRVRITDSFTHYHPVEGGFDEFYLVQMVQPNARILTSSMTAKIVDPQSVTAKDAASMFEETPLAVGDLVYLPRGTVHRGVDGVLAHVIAAPGFVPDTEIGVDHHLRRINGLLGLQGEDALPFHVPAAEAAVVK